MYAKRESSINFEISVEQKAERFRQKPENLIAREREPNRSDFRDDVRELPNR